MPNITDALLSRTKVTGEAIEGIKIAATPGAPVYMALGMVCLGFEIDPRYASVVIDRWEAASGKTAELIGELPSD